MKRLTQSSVIIIRKGNIYSGLLLPGWFIHFTELFTRCLFCNIVLMVSSKYQTSCSSKDWFYLVPTLFEEFACIFVGNLSSWLWLPNWCNEQHDINRVAYFEKCLYFFYKKIASILDSLSVQNGHITWQQLRCLLCTTAKQYWMLLLAFPKWLYLVSLIPTGYFCGWPQLSVVFQSQTPPWC
jgi:hypothetical protein